MEANVEDNGAISRFRNKVLVPRMADDPFGSFVQRLEGEESRSPMVWTQRHVEAKLTRRKSQTRGAAQGLLKTWSSGTSVEKVWLRAVHREC